MTCKILGSGSSGNSYVLTSSTGEALLLECGIRFNEVKRALKYDLKKVVGQIISHRHLDHAKYSHDVAKAGIDIYCLQDTADSFNFTSHRIKVIEPLKQFKVGSFTIMPFALRHDCPCVGFLINHLESGKICFITDTSFVTQRFNNINQYMIEANYCEEILEERAQSGTIHSFLHDRVIKSHLSLQNALGVLASNDLSAVNNILVLHLSDSNSDAQRFQKVISQATGKTTTIAKKGITLDFNLHPF